MTGRSTCCPSAPTTSTSATASRLLERGSGPWPVMLACEPLMVELYDPAVILKDDWLRWNGRVPCTQHPPQISDELWERLVERGWSRGLPLHSPRRLTRAGRCELAWLTQGSGDASPSRARAFSPHRRLLTRSMPRRLRARAAARRGRRTQSGTEASVRGVPCPPDGGRPPRCHGERRVPDRGTGVRRRLAVRLGPARLPPKPREEGMLARSLGLESA